VKLGGSLLDLPDLTQRLQDVALMLMPSKMLLIPGGGMAADCIRSLDQQFGLTPEQAHQTAIEAMKFNAELLARLNPEFCIVADLNEALRAWENGRLPVLNASAFLRHQQQPGGGERGDSGVLLPASWDVTSDSIAAWVAARCGAMALVILKSCDPVSNCIDVLIEHRMLDVFFRRTAGSFPIQWLNLRKSPLQFVTLADKSPSAF
jgi:aspartokinase-like uncharacterized kinase